jgi:hypothetical protein
VKGKKGPDCDEGGRDGDYIKRGCDDGQGRAGRMERKMRVGTE